MLRFLEKHAAQAKDSGYSWIICLVCVMINFFVTGFTHTIGLLFSYLLEDIGSTRAKTCKFGPLCFDLPLFLWTPVSMQFVTEQDRILVGTNGC